MVIRHQALSVRFYFTFDLAFQSICTWQTVIFTIVQSVLTLAAHLLFLFSTFPIFNHQFRSMCAYMYMLLNFYIFFALHIYLQSSHYFFIAYCFLLPAWLALNLIELSIFLLAFAMRMCFCCNEGKNSFFFFCKLDIIQWNN